MEIEAKYAITSADTFNRLRQGEPLASYALSFRSEQDVADTYFDTADRRLWAAGFALRVRDGVQPGRAWVTLKGRGTAHGAVHRRSELETEVAAGSTPADWADGALSSKLAELTQGEPLVEILRLEQHRVLHDIRRNHRDIGVRFLDRVTFHARGRSQTLLEVEFELGRHGSVDDLRAIEHALETYNLQPEPRSKFERALAWADSAAAPAVPAFASAAAGASGAPGWSAHAAPDVASAPAPVATTPPVVTKKPEKPKPPLVRATDDIADAGCRILEFHAARMRLHEPGTRSGDADALHDMRVATRRQRSLLRILKPWLRRKKAEHFRAALSETATALGRVRDLDVLIETANAYCQAQKPGRTVAIAPLLAAWNAERTEARTALLAILDSDAWKEFDAAYQEFLAAPAGAHRAPHTDSGHERAPHLVAHIVPGEAWTQYGVVRAYEAEMKDAPFETLHRLRVEAKRLRYLLEFFQTAFASDVGPSIKALTALQDHLGTMNDFHVAAARVRAFLETHAAATSVRTLVAVRGYLTHLETERNRRRARLEPVWTAVAGTEFREELGRAVTL